MISSSLLRAFALTLSLVLTGEIFCYSPPAYGEEIKRPKLNGIKGEDDRKMVENSDQYPWRAIGRINKSTGGFCTGALIGERLVLTAAHCVMNENRKRYHHPSSLHFLAGYKRGDYQESSPVVEIIPSPKFDVSIGETIVNAAEDWAFVVLEKPIGRTLGSFGILNLGVPETLALKTNKTNVTQAGYSKDKSHILTVNTTCPILGYDKQKNLIAHSCDAVSGDSGSPLFIRDEKGGYQIIAIHVATTKKGKPELGIAVPGSSILRHLKTTNQVLNSEELIPNPKG